MDKNEPCTDIYIPCKAHVQTSSIIKTKVIVAGIYHVYTNTYCFFIHVCVHTCLEFVHAMYIPCTYVKCTKSSFFVHV